MLKLIRFELYDGTTKTWRELSRIAHVITTDRDDADMLTLTTHARENLATTEYFNPVRKVRIL